MTSTASKTIIDQWVVSVPVAPEPPAEPQLPAPDVARLYSADVCAVADRRFGPRPYVLTINQRAQIAAELDYYSEAERAKLRRKYQKKRNL